MEQKTAEKLIRELREQANDLMAAAQLLAPLVRERGEERDGMVLASLEKSLYCLVRTVSHLELCREEEPDLCLKVVDLNGLCEKVCQQIESLAPVLEIRFTWEVEGGEILTLADPTLVEQALLNLLANAVRAAGRGGEVSLHCRKEGERCLFLIRDNGAGVCFFGPGPDSLVKDGSGLGLGLALARRVAALHGGTLMLENTAGDGARSVLALPIRLPEKGEELRAARTEWDRTGGFSPLLVELSPLLPVESFHFRELE